MITRHNDRIVNLGSWSSKVGATVSRGNLPISPTLAQMFPDIALSSALYGGEDFELVLCLPQLMALELVKQIGSGAAIVGKITPSTDILLVDDTGKYPPLQLDLHSGFKHF